MSSMTDATEKKVAVAMLNGGTYTGGILFAALLTSDPDEAGGVGGEISDSAYRRKPIAATAAAQFTALDALGVASNVSAVTFDALAADLAKPVTHIGICSAVSGSGNMVLHSALAVPRVLLAGAVPFFDIGEIRVLFD